MLQGLGKYLLTLFHAIKCCWGIYYLRIAMVTVSFPVHKCWTDEHDVTRQFGKLVCAVRFRKKSPVQSLPSELSQARQKQRYTVSCLKIMPKTEHELLK